MQTGCRFKVMHITNSFKIKIGITFFNATFKCEFPVICVLDSQFYDFMFTCKDNITAGNEIGGHWVTIVLRPAITTIFQFHCQQLNICAIGKNLQ